MGHRKGAIWPGSVIRHPNSGCGNINGGRSPGRAFFLPNRAYPPSLQLLRCRPILVAVHNYLTVLLTLDSLPERPADPTRSTGDTPPTRAQVHRRTAPGPCTRAKHTVYSSYPLDELEISKTSPMPQGLFSRMTKDEILDLVAYLISAGNAKHEYFAN